MEYYGIEVETLLPTEEDEQKRLFSWARLNEGAHPELKLMFHIPNGGKRGKAEAGRFKAQGVKAGVPDIFLAVPRGAYHGLFIEMKRQQGGKATPEQRQWLQELNGRGYRAVIAKGWEAAREEITQYLELTC